MPRCASTRGTASKVSQPCSWSLTGSLSLTNKAQAKPRSAKRSLPARLAHYKSPTTKPRRTLRDRPADAVCLCGMPGAEESVI
jgi:hypothetical protein